MKKIYLIDDDDDVREVMSFALQEENYNVESFCNAQLAFNKLQTLSSSQYPDLIFVDYYMPQMNGLEFIHQVKNVYPETFGTIPLVLCSAQSDLASTSNLPSGVNLLTKPMDLNQLLGLAASLV